MRMNFLLVVIGIAKVDDPDALSVLDEVVRSDVDKLDALGLVEGSQRVDDAVPHIVRESTDARSVHVADIHGWKFVHDHVCLVISLADLWRQTHLSGYCLKSNLVGRAVFAKDIHGAEVNIFV